MADNPQQSSRACYLLGDPTLTAYVVTPPTALSAYSTNSGGVYQVRLNWTDSTEDEGYYVYRGANIANALTNVIASLAQNTTGCTNSPVQTNTTYTYLVRAVKLFASGGGSFYQLSRAATTNITVNP